MTYQEIIDKIDKLSEQEGKPYRLWWASYSDLGLKPGDIVPCELYYEYTNYNGYDNLGWRYVFYIKPSNIYIEMVTDRHYNSYYNQVVPHIIQDFKPI